jgi:hypothetical protein
MGSLSIRPRRPRTPVVWVSCAAALVLAASVTPQAFGSSHIRSVAKAADVTVAAAPTSKAGALTASDAASAAGAAAGRQAAAGAVRAGNFLGVTFGFTSGTLDGSGYGKGNGPAYNLPMYKPDGNNAHFWDSYVEQLQTAGVDFVAPTIRGSIPGKPQFDGAGAPAKLAGLVSAIQRRGANIKVSALDDTAASLTALKNEDKHNRSSYTPRFDVADVNGTGEGGYKYMWNYNLQEWYKAVPANLRFAINGHPVIYEWSLADAFFVNQGNGHAAAMLRYVKQQAQAQFGVAPYFIVDDTWISKDPAVANVADGVDNWFTMAHSYTLATFKGQKFGALAPGFHVGTGSTAMNIDPNHGNTFKTGLQSTVGAGALVTLVEGFTDLQENCAMWRGRPGTYAATRYDYPNQMINILRQYSRDPFPTGTRIEAEGADSYYDTTSGNASGTYRDGDLDVLAVTDQGPGWAVGSTAAGEWLQWQEIPLSGTVTLKVRMSSVTAGRQVRFTIDGKAGPVVTVPDTGSWTTYQTVDAGTFTLAANSHHTVRVTFLNGGVNLNYWSD